MNLELDPPSSSSSAPSLAVSNSSPVNPAPSEAFEFVRVCLSEHPENAPRERLRAFVETGIDWDAVQKAAARHRVLPLFYRRLEALLGETVPVSVREAGREHRRSVRIRNAFLAQELGRIVEVFQEAGLPVLTLKGPVLSKAALGDIASRHSVDVDVVIPGARFSEADRLLHDMGYEYAAKRASLEGWRKTLSLYFDGQWEFTRGASFTVDVHTRIMPSGYSFPAGVHPFLERARSMALREGLSVPSLSTEDRLLVLAHQGVKNQWRILRHVADIAGLLQGQSEVDWSLLQTRAQRLHTTRTVKLGLLLAHGLLNASLPPSVREWIEDGPLRHLRTLMESHLRNRHRRDALQYSERVRLQLTTKDTVADQLRYGMHSLLQHLWDSLLRP